MTLLPGKEDHPAGEKPTTSRRTAAGTTSPPSRKAHRVLWGLQVVMAIVFLGAAYTKFSADPHQVEVFGEIGFGSWFMYFIASVELAGGVGLLIPALCGLAATGLSALLFGAIFAQFAIGEPLIALVPIAYLIPLAPVAWGRRHTIPKLLQAVTRR